MIAELCVCGVDTGPPCRVQGCLIEPGERETATHQGGQLRVAAFTLQKREAPQKLERSPWRLTHHRTIAETEQRCKSHFLPPWQAPFNSYNRKATGTLVPGHTRCLSAPDTFKRGLFLHVMTQNYTSRSTLT